MGTGTGIAMSMAAGTGMGLVPGDRDGDEAGTGAALRKGLRLFGRLLSRSEQNG